MGFLTHLDYSAFRITSQRIYDSSDLKLRYFFLKRVREMTSIPPKIFLNCGLNAIEKIDRLCFDIAVRPSCEVCCEMNMQVTACSVVSTTALLFACLDGVVITPLSSSCCFIYGASLDIRRSRRYDMQDRPMPLFAPPHMAIEEVKKPQDQIMEG